MVNELLINLVNNVLGQGKRTSRGNQSYTCPFCNHHKPKLEINFTINPQNKNPWACWACGKKGNSIRTLFKQSNQNSEFISQLNSLIPSTQSHILYQEKLVTSSQISLPPEFKHFDNTIISRHAQTYLNKRNITQDDIDKYGIGFCEYGEYAKSIIIPSYDSNGNLNYFTSRSFEKDPYIKYKNPNTSRDIIPFEMFINWDLPIILCEGPFDAIAIKRNAIPLFGKNIQSSLMKKIVTSKIQKIYIALDNDALKKSLEFCELLLNEGKEVYLVKLEGKDPSDMGFEYFTKLIQKTTPLTNYKLMENKLQLI